MPSVTWATKQDLIPVVRETSRKDFRPPTTIEDDFRRLLAHDVPHVNYTFELIHDWYFAHGDKRVLQILESSSVTNDVVIEYTDNFGEITVTGDVQNTDHYWIQDADLIADINALPYSPVLIRAQQTPIDWKSKIGNSDMATNFKVTHDVEIFKGDIVIREDGKIYMLNWNIQDHPNNQATQNCECNGLVTFKRRVPEITNEAGYVIMPEHDEQIAPLMPIIHTEYAGRPDYMPSQWTPGVNADHLITVQVQYNQKTKNLRIDDTFEMDNYTYRIINIAFAEVHIDNDYGILDLNCKRVAGGGIVGE